MQQRQFPHEHQNQIERSHKRYFKLVSLRVKLLIGFSVLFSIVFAGAYYWFYSFATERTISRLRTDMRNTITGAVKGVDVDELMELYATGLPNSAGFSDDPRYHRQLAWFEAIHSVEPRAWFYIYAVGNAANNRRVGPSAVQPNQLELIYLVDLWANYDPSKAARFLQSDVPGPTARQVLRERGIVETPKIYTDQWGSWLSAFAPLVNEEGAIVAILGLDIKADYVLKVQQEIRSRVVISFIITYGVLFVLIYVLSGVLTQQLSDLTESAERIGAGDYSIDLSLLARSRLPDEMSALAQVFESMVDSIRTREQMIREGKQVEDEMRIALQEERELNELKSRFVSMVSHELRTPLTVIRTSLELLERYGSRASEEKKQEYFQRSRAAVEHMNQLLEDVLTLGQSEVGKLEFKPIQLNLEQFCSEIVEEMQLGMGRTHVISFHSEGICNNAAIDPSLLRSILTNLISNAVKYSSIGSTVEFELFCLEQKAVFEVRDHGIGIPQHDQSRLFEQFHRATNVSTIRGTGLGLAIVRECVAQHHGEITFTSQEGIGTMFRVTLPLNPISPIVSASTV